MLSSGRNWQVLDLVALQGMLAHSRGEWFERLRLELQRTRDTPDLATAVFDGHLCVAEFLLYGPMPYAEVIELATGLRTTAERAGALPAAERRNATAASAGRKRVMFFSVDFVLPQCTGRARTRQSEAAH